MFGGHGLYHEGCMFGLVADDTLYLKVDEGNIHYFAELDLAPFEYEKSDGKKMAMSYRLAPESIFEDQDEAAVWAGHAWEAARRAKAKKAPRVNVSAKKSKSKKGSRKKSASKKSASKKTTER